MQNRNNLYERFGREPTQPAQPKVVTSVSTCQRQPREKYQFHLHKFGIVEIILCCIVCSICIASLVVQSITDSLYRRSTVGGTYVSPGLWCGAFLLVCGILGVKARNNASVCIYTANIVASIFASIMMASLITLSVMCSVWTEILYPSDAYVRAMHNTNAVMGFAALVVCVIHSAYCCVGLCCVDTNQTVIHASQEITQMANGQYMSVPETGVTTQSQQHSS